MNPENRENDFAAALLKAAKRAEAPVTMFLSNGSPAVIGTVGSLRHGWVEIKPLQESGTGRFAAGGTSQLPEWVKIGDITRVKPAKDLVLDEIQAA